MIEKIYKKAIYALARVAVKYIELRKKREQKKIKQNKSANLTNSTKSCTDAEYNKKVVAEINHNNSGFKQRRGAEGCRTETTYQ